MSKHEIETVDLIHIVAVAHEEAFGARLDAQDAARQELFTDFALKVLELAAGRHLAGEAPKFKIGVTVRLKSGGPAMTIISPLADGSGGWDCRWFAYSEHPEMFQAGLPEAALNLLKGEPEEASERVADAINIVRRISAAEPGETKP